MRALKASRCVERDRRKVRCSGDTDLLIGLRHAPFCSGDIRAALQKLGRRSSWDDWRLSLDRRRRQAELRGRLADEDGDRMFKLRSFDTNIGILDTRGVQLRLRLSHICSWRNASLETMRRELHIVGISFHRIVETLFLSVIAAQIEIVHGEFSLETELGGLVVAGRGLRLFAGGRNASPDASP